MKKNLLLYISASLFAFSLSAQTVVSVETPGKLSGVLDANNIKPDTLTRLKLSGTVDKRDFDALKVTINSLEYLDMTGLSIVAYTDGTIEHKANSIPISAFNGFTKLQTVLFPNQLRGIENTAFYNTPLREVILPDSLVYLDNKVFSFCNYLTSVHIPSKLKSYSKSFAYCKLLEAITVADDNPLFASVDGVLYSKNKKNVYQYPIAKKNNTFTFPFPEKLATVWDEAFADCQYLKEIVCPDSVFFQGNLRECNSLETITIGSFSYGLALNKEIKNVYFTGTTVPGANSFWLYVNINKVDLSTITLYVRPELIGRFKQSENFGPEFTYVAWTPTGVETPQVQNNKITIFPNPAQNAFTINGIDESVNVTITDILGKKVLYPKINPSNYINISNLQKGVYNVTIQHNKTSVSIKLFKI
jgi:hypothetical protein